jgi:hypothetical protein
MLYSQDTGDIGMTRDRIVEVAKKAAKRVARTEVGTPAKEKYVKRLAELKTKRAANAGQVTGGKRLRA